MRTTLTLDDDFLRDLSKETGKKAPLDAIREALHAYLRHQKLKKVIALRGTMDIEDYSQELRQLEIDSSNRQLRV